MPAIMPIKTAPCAPSSKLQTVPTATPPASVEFCTCTISNLFSWLTSADTTKVVTAREKEREIQCEHKVTPYQAKAHFQHVSGSHMHTTPPMLHQEFLLRFQWASFRIVYVYILPVGYSYCLLLVSISCIFQLNLK